MRPERGGPNYESGLVEPVRAEVATGGPLACRPMPESKRRKPKNTGRTRPKKAMASKVAKAPSPKWYVILMFALMGAGAAFVLARLIFFTDQQWMLLAGLGGIAAGFIMTTNYR